MDDSLSSNFSRKCRACLEDVEHQEYVDLEAPLFGEDDNEDEAPSDMDELSLLEVFNECTQLQVRLDDEDEEMHPEWEACRYLCNLCIGDLRKAYQFIVKARLSNEALVKLKKYNSTDDDEKEFQAIDTLEEEGTENEIVDLDLNSISSEDQVSEPHKKHSLSRRESKSGADSTKEMQEIDEVKGLETEISQDEEDDDEDDDATSIVVRLVNSDQDCEGEGDDDRRQHMLEFKCELCTEKFDFQRHLMQHYDRDHDEKNLHFACSSCDHRFFTKSALNVHIRQIHQNEKYIDCYVCGRTVLKTFFKVHLKRHDKKQRYLCTECPSTFTTKYTLKKHQSIHSENRDRNFECEVCGRKFYTLESFRTHQIVHQERDKYSCSLCEKTFMRQTNLKLHMQMHRGETMDCPHCGKKFVRRKDMEIHIRFHTGDFPYACETCGKRFAIKGHLNAHEKKHDGIKYQCSSCDKLFINKAGLRQHSFEHTGMPLQCGVCQKGFPTRFKVRRHVRCVHHHLFTQGFSNELADQYIKEGPISEVSKDVKSEIPGSAEEDYELEMLEEDEDDLVKFLVQEM